jgi:hypothetical protein
MLRRRDGRRQGKRLSSYFRTCITTQATQETTPDTPAAAASRYQRDAESLLTAASRSEILPACPLPSRLRMLVSSQRGMFG